MPSCSAFGCTYHSGSKDVSFSSKSWRMLVQCQKRRSAAIWKTFWCMCCSLLHLMSAITRTHFSTLATCLIHVKNSKHHFWLRDLIFRTFEWRKSKNEKTSNWIVYHFSLSFVNLSWIWMLCFHIWLPKRGKF